jgi:ribose 5-phosphate isomerase B
MSPISNQEIEQIVSRVMSQLGDSSLRVENGHAGHKTVALGADHGGFAMKEMLKAHLASAGHQIIDCGTNSTDSVDYPDFARAVAEKVSAKEACCGIIVDGAGIGSCMAANKVDGVRAAMCHDYATAVNSREHNHANVLTLGAGLIGNSLAKQIVDTWMATPYGKGRHASRVKKIMAIEALNEAA